MTATQPIISHAPTMLAPKTPRPHSGKVTIASVFPMERRAVRSHARHTLYILPGAPRDSFSALTVYDTYALVKVFSEEGERFNEIGPRDVPSMVVAQCLLSQWAGQTIAAQAGHGPGIDIIAGDAPTDGELAHLRAKQTGFFQWLINDANDKSLAGENKNITDIHRFAAKWLLDRGAERLTWYKKIEYADVKDCPACGKQIIAVAIRCEHCTVELPDFYLKYGLDPDPAVAAVIARMTQPKAASEPPAKVSVKG